MRFTHESKIVLFVCMCVCDRTSVDVGAKTPTIFSPEDLQGIKESDSEKSSHMHVRENYCYFGPISVKTKQHSLTSSKKLGVDLTKQTTLN